MEDNATNAAVDFLIPNLFRLFKKCSWYKNHVSDSSDYISH